MEPPRTAIGGSCAESLVHGKYYIIPAPTSGFRNAPWRCTTKKLIDATTDASTARARIDALVTGGCDRTEVRL
jgi:hypothetical protein